MLQVNGYSLILLHSRILILRRARNFALRCNAEDEAGRVHFEYELKFLALLALPYLLYYLLGETLHQMRPTAFDQAGHLRLQLEPWQMKEKWDLECSRKKAAARRQAEAEAKAEAAAERQAERERSHKKSLYRKDRKGLSRKKRASKERAGTPPTGERSVGGRAGAAEMV